MIRVSSMQHQRGIGMIEVLIAVLVVSIGFLGMAALQAKALSTNNSATARSMAIVASYSVIDAMRADIVNAKNGAYNTTVTANACTAASGNLASYQLNAWCVELGNTLGAAATTTGQVNCSVLGDCTVTIQFDDSRAGGSAAQGGSTAETITAVTQL